MLNPFVEGYVGVTSRSIEKRLKEHRKSNNNPHLKRSFAKYDLSVEILEEDTSEYILLLEGLYRPHDGIGWNITKGGGVPPNSRTWWTESHRKAASERLVGNSHRLNKKDTDETREKKSKSFHEDYERRCFHLKNRSPETQAKNNLARKGKGLGERNAMASSENRAKVGASKVGRRLLVSPQNTRHYVRAEDIAQKLSEGYRYP